MTSNKNDRNNNYDNNNNNNNNPHHEKEIYTVDTRHTTSNMRANNNINTNSNDDSGTISDLCYESNEEVTKIFYINIYI